MKKGNKQCLFDTSAEKWSIHKMMSEYKVHKIDFVYVHIAAILCKKINFPGSNLFMQMSNVSVLRWQSIESCG